MEDSPDMEKSQLDLLQATKVKDPKQTTTYKMNLMKMTDAAIECLNSTKNVTVNQFQSMSEKYEKQIEEMTNDNNILMNYSIKCIEDFRDASFRKLDKVTTKFEEMKYHNDQLEKQLEEMKKQQLISNKQISLLTKNMLSEHIFRDNFQKSPPAQPHSDQINSPLQVEKKDLKHTCHKDPLVLNKEQHEQDQTLHKKQLDHEQNDLKHMTAMDLSADSMTSTKKAKTEYQTHINSYSPFQTFVPNASQDKNNLFIEQNNQEQLTPMDLSGVNMTVSKTVRTEKQPNVISFPPYVDQSRFTNTNQVKNTLLKKQNDDDHMLAMDLTTGNMISSKKTSNQPVSDFVSDFVPETVDTHITTELDNFNEFLLTLANNQ